MYDHDRNRLKRAMTSTSGKHQTSDDDTHRKELTATTATLKPQSSPKGGRHIAVFVDGSYNSNRALEQALQSLKSNDRISIVHVIDTVDIIPVEGMDIYLHIYVLSIPL
jgi:hypothetical protein